MHKMPPTITTSDQDSQQHLRKNKVQFRTLTVHIPMQKNIEKEDKYTKEEKHCTFFEEYTSREENETSKFPGEGRENT